MENAQFLERYRLLSRDIQNGIQKAQKRLSEAKLSSFSQDITSLKNTLTEINDAWLDFSGWVLIGTLDCPEDARCNCAPGKLDIASKINRSKMRRIHDITRNALKIDTSSCKSQIIESYIPYFEQLLDLLFCNAIKYSPSGGTIEISTSSSDSGVNITIDSVGPLLQKHEIQNLGNKGFRSENALKTPTTGQGYGLYNVIKIAELLGGSVQFNPDHRTLFQLNTIPLANFSVTIHLPNILPHSAALITV